MKSLAISTAIFSVLLTLSCNKTVLPDHTTRQREILSQIGFDVTHITFKSSSDIQPLTFATVAEAKRYFDGLRKQARPFELIVTSSRKPRFSPYSDTLESVTVTTVIYTVSMTNWLLWNGWNVTFSYQSTSGAPVSQGGTSSDPIITSNWSSQLVGITLAMGWQHVSSDSFVDNGRIYFTIRGIQEYNLFTEGIGTVFSEPVIIHGNFDVNTGKGNMVVAHAY